MTANTTADLAARVLNAVDGKHARAAQSSAYTRKYLAEIAVNVTRADYLSEVENASASVMRTSAAEAVWMSAKQAADYADGDYLAVDWDGLLWSLAGYQGVHASTLRGDARAAYAAAWTEACADLRGVLKPLIEAVLRDSASVKA